METRASYVVVGTFVLAMIVALFGFIIYIAKVEFDQVSLPYYVYFDGSVTGLQDGSPVRYRGVPIGVVGDIRVDPQDPSKVRVRMDVHSDAVLTQDAIASIELQGITGVAYIQIVGGRKDSPPIERQVGVVPVIPSKPSQISEVFDAAPELLNRLIRLSSRAEQFLSPENAERFGRIMEDVETITDSLSTDGAATLHDVRTASSRFADAAETLSGLAQSLDKTAREARRILAENRGPIRDFTNTGLYDLGLMIADMRELSASLKRLVAQIERDPSGFLLAGPRQGVEAK